jgi:peptidoglycan hydrolase CwlO-like protein
MLKKSLMGAGAALGIGALVFGTSLPSYLRTAGNQVKESVKAEVPVEFEIERARDMVTNLEPDIKTAIHEVAEQEADVENLEEQIARKQADMKTQWEDIAVLRNDLDSGKTEFVHFGKTFTKDEVKNDLTDRFARYKVAQEALDRDKELMDARMKMLKANKDKLANMLSARKTLEVEIEKLEAQLKTIEAAETVSELELDDTRLNRAKQLVRDIDRRLDVRQKVLNTDAEIENGLIKVEKPSDRPKEITQEIDEFIRERGLDQDAPEVEAQPEA